MSDAQISTIKVPNPFVEGRNCVYVVTGEPITMIDTGTATDRAYDELIAGLAEINLTPRDIKRIILTHKHIDHIGNAWRIQQESGAEVLIHDCELSAVTNVDPSGERHAALVLKRLDEWNVPAKARPSGDEASLLKWKIESAKATALIDGQRLTVGDGELEVIHTPGHTMGSICLRLGRYVFTGDHVLPDISPNVGGGDMRGSNLLRHYLDSLNRIRDLCDDDDLQVMPGHGDPMATLTERCNELISHHEQRLDELVAILRHGGEQTVYEIARQLFGEMKSFHVVLGCAEASAHLEYLVQQGRVASQQGSYVLI